MVCIVCFAIAKHITNDKKEWVPIGPRFSNAILQTLLVLFKRIPPKGRKLLVVGTTNNEDVLRQMEFMDCFSSIVKVPVISNIEEFKKAIAGLQVNFFSYAFGVFT